MSLSISSISPISYASPITAKPTSEPVQATPVAALPNNVTTYAAVTSPAIIATQAAVMRLSLGLNL